MYQKRIKNFIDNIGIVVFSASKSVAIKWVSCVSDNCREKRTSKCLLEGWREINKTKRIVISHQIRPVFVHAKLWRIKLVIFFCVCCLSTYSALHDFRLLCWKKSASSGSDSKDTNDSSFNGMINYGKTIHFSSMFKISNLVSMFCLKKIKMSQKANNKTAEQLYLCWTGKSRFYCLLSYSIYRWRYKGIFEWKP